MTRPATKPLRPLAVGAAALLTPFWAIFAFAHFPLIIGPDSDHRWAARQGLATLAAFGMVPVTFTSAIFAATISTDPHKRYPLAFVLLCGIGFAAFLFTKSLDGLPLLIALTAVATNAAIVVQGVFPDD